MIPVYLAVFTLYYPKANKVTMRVTGFIGFVTGLLAFFTFFGMPEAWWLGVLYLALPVVSVYALVLSFRGATLSAERPGGVLDGGIAGGKHGVSRHYPR